MNSTSMFRCQDYLTRLGAQIEVHLPPANEQGRTFESVPLERLPTVAALVREYVECEALLASVGRTDGDNTNGSHSDG